MNDNKTEIVLLWTNIRKKLLKTHRDSEYVLCSSCYNRWCKGEVEVHDHDCILEEFNTYMKYIENIKYNVLKECYDQLYIWLTMDQIECIICGADGNPWDHIHNDDCPLLLMGRYINADKPINV